MVTDMKSIRYMWVKGREGKLHKLTPRDIVNHLEDEIKSGREWSISPEELVEISSRVDFSETKSNQVKTLILRFCADCLTHNIESEEEIPSIYVITYCYYTSYGDDGVEAKHYYKQCCIESAIRRYLGKDYLEPKTENWCNKWEAAALKNFCRFFGPEISRWETKIYKRFVNDYETFFSTEALKTGN